MRPTRDKTIDAYFRVKDLLLGFGVKESELKDLWLLRDQNIDYHNIVEAIGKIKIKYKDTYPSSHQDGYEDGQEDMLYQINTIINGDKR